MFRRTLVYGLMLLVVIALAACASSAPAGAAGSVTVTASEFKFSPATINATAGQTVNLTVVNSGAVVHTWVLDQGNVKVSVNSGQTVTQSFTAPSTPGTYKFYCDVPGHQEAGMIGQLIVK
jgi:plastocyanin